MRRASSYASSSRTPTAVRARAISPFEYGRSRLPRKSRSPLRRSLMRRPPSARRSSSASRSCPSTVSTSLPASTTSAPRSLAASATTSIAAAFSSTRNTSASTLASSVRSCSRSARLPETWTTSAPCSSRRCSAKIPNADSGAVEKNATVRPSTDSAGFGRSVVAITVRRQRERSAVQLLPAAAGLGHRQDHEVGDEVPVLVQVAGDDVRVLLGVDDEDPAARRDGREGRAAAVEHDEVGAELDGQPRSLVDVRDRDRAGEPAAAAAATDRLDAGERGRLEIVRRRVAPGARELEQRVEVRRDASRPRAREARLAPSRRRRPSGRAQAAARRGR